MLFKLTDEQKMIQNMVREFSRKVVAPLRRNGTVPRSFRRRISGRWGN